MPVHLKDEQDLTVGLGTLWAFLDGRGLTYKKKQLTPRSRTART